MAQIVASIKCFPEDIITNLATIYKEIEKALPSFASLYRIEDEPIAFGLVAIIVHVVIPESEGDRLGEVEDVLRKIKGISEVETLLVRRI
jgi:elongation factor 1-beta